jgi:hypothetical protein
VIYPGWATHNSRMVPGWITEYSEMRPAQDTEYLDKFPGWDTEYPQTFPGWLADHPEMYPAQDTEYPAMFPFGPQTNLMRTVATFQSLYNLSSTHHPTIRHYSFIYVTNAPKYTTKQ